MATNIQILSLFAICALFPASYSQSTGGPSCNLGYICDLATVGDNVPDPYDCTQYYKCVGDPLAPSDALECGSNSYFDPKDAACSTYAPNEASCLPECGAPKDYCNTLCESIVGRVIPDPTTCTGYLLCSAGAPIQRNCTDLLPYFDGEECQSNPALCCSSCTAYCTEADAAGGGSQIRDPCNCNRFFFCTERGYPTESGSCTFGEYVDPDLGTCVTFPIGVETCENYCDANPPASSGACLA